MLALDWYTQLPMFRGKRRVLSWLTHLFPRAELRPYRADIRLRGKPGEATFIFSVIEKGDDFVSHTLRAYPTNTTFIDIGANIGVYAIQAAKAFDQGRVFAVEPNPLAFRYLVENAQANMADNMTLCCAAVYSKGQSTIPLKFEPSHLGGASICESRSKAIEVLTIDRQWFNNLGPLPGPCLVKIDVEGAEQIVMQELFASDLVSEVQGLLVEFNHEICGAGVAQLAASLESAGFSEVGRREGEKLYDAHYRRDGLGLTIVQGRVGT